MAGKSNKGRNRKVSHAATAAAATNSADQVVSSEKDSNSPSESVIVDANANGVPAVSESTIAQADVQESDTANSADEPKQGDVFTLLLLFMRPGFWCLIG